jgi:DsbC/DsbD-like thiol-disulfide interchange protein
VLALMVCGAMRAQEISLDGPRPVPKQHLLLLSDAVQLEAGRPQVVELRFRVDPGFHINSHAPHDETLIPTVLTLDAGDGVQVQDASYPAGTAFRLTVGAGQTLDVYQGEFRVLVKVLARKGEWTLTGGLRYQACDSAACFPPRTLPVRVAVEAR